jgi:hypothetical protein
MRATLLLLSVLGAAELRAQAATDTMVRVTGIVKAERAGASQWGLFLPAPIVVGGVRLTWLAFEGTARQASTLEERFVEAVGTVRFRTDAAGVVAVTLVDPQLQEREPPGTVHNTVQLSITQRAAVALAVVPSVVAWHDSTGRPSGVHPILWFRLVNHGDVPIQMTFPGYEVLCVRVHSLELVVLDTSWAIKLPGARNISLVMGQRFQEILLLPPEAAPKAGRYRVRVGLCGKEYGAEMMFEVTG